MWTVSEASDGSGKTQKPCEDIELAIQTAEHYRRLAGQHARL